MNDDLKDAETWFKTASSVIEENPRVACAQFSHAMIKALDALFKEKLGRTPGKHDKAVDYFKELLQKNLIKSEESKYRRSIQQILQKKSTAEYHTEYFSRSDAVKWRKKVKRIMDMVKRYVEDEE
ncbi:MAG: HEPN domain-containing protein [Candidatus Thermoplasmatota archaeon]|nr:HEPN domain-containing protein [Candidatus Thermoplasmatota archaeon]